MIPCPPTPSLQGYLAGRLPLEQIIPLEAHVAGCARCRDRLTEGTRPLRPRPGPPDSARCDLAPRLPDVPGYDVVRQLGQGGMGVVFLARHHSLGRFVALKMIRDSPLATDNDRQRFLREAQTASRISHPGVVQVYEVGQCPAGLYLALEYVPGPTLSAHLQQGGPLPPRAAAHLVALLADAVQAAHTAGVVHRDLKPGNVLLAAHAPGDALPASGRPTVPQEPFAPKVTDFGLARWLDGGDPLTAPSVIAGTPAYMAPEQFSRAAEVSEPADVYALGVMLHECLTGEVPFDAPNPVEQAFLVLGRDPAPPSRRSPGVPRDLDQITLQCLEKAPARRYPSAAHLAADLRRFLAGLPVVARPVGPGGRLWRLARRHPVVAVLLAALATLTPTALVIVSAAWLRADREWRRAEALAGEQSRGRLEAERREALRLTDLYVARMNLAQQHLALQQVEHARELLALHADDESRDFEWHHLDRVARAERWCVRLGPGARQPTASPDGLRLAVLVGPRVRVLDARTGLDLPAPALTSAASTVAFLPDGRIVTASGDRLSLWPQGGGAATVLAAPPGANGRPRGLVALAAAPDGRRLAGLAVEAFSTRAEVILWDVPGARALAQVPAPGNRTSLAFAANNDLCLGDLTSVRFYRGDAGLLVGQVGGASVRAQTLLNCPSRPLLAACSPEGSVTLIDAATRKPRATFRVPTGLAAAAFSADGERFLALATDRKVRAFTVGGAPLPGGPHPPRGGGTALLTLPDSTDLISLTGEGLLSRWHPEDADGGPRHPLWEGARAADLARLPQTTLLAPDGAHVALLLTGAVRVRSTTPWGPDRTWNVAAGQSVRSALLQPDGSALIATSSGRLTHWTPSTDARTDWPTPPGCRITALAASPDGTSVTAGDERGIVWRLGAATPPGELGRLSSRVSALAVHPAGTAVAALDADGALTFLPREDPDAAPGGPALAGFAASALAFDPTSGRLALGGRDGSVLVLAGVAGSVLARSRAHVQPVVGLAFSPNGRRLASTSRDGLVKVLDAGTGQGLLVLVGQEGGSPAVAFTEGGDSLLSVDGSATLRRWRGR